MKACSVTGCEKQALCKGLCSSHYQKRRLHGTINGNPITPRWRVDDMGYMAKRTGGKKIRQHVAVASAALGKPLPKGAVVHHINGIKIDNRPSNLVICQNEAYHQILHRRQRAYDATGNANMRQCVFCKQWSLVGEIIVNRANSSSYHQSCRNASRRAAYSSRKDAP